MKCSKCNGPLYEGDLFCENCGQPVSPPIDQSVPNQEGTGKKKRLSTKWLVLIILAILVLCCCVVLVAGYFLYDNGLIFSDDTYYMDTAQQYQPANEPVQPDMSNQPDQSEQELSVETFPAPVFEESGVKIWFDETLLQNVRLVQVDPTPTGGYVPWDYAPMHLSLEVQQPQGVIHFVPVDAYIGMGDFANETIEELQRSLDNHPAVASWGCIPTWDYPCPHQEMNINISYFDFQNGSGIRSVTVYAPQNTSAINNKAIDYYYNGLTDDGLFYVYAKFDLDHAALSEDDWDLSIEVMTESEALKEYVITNGEMLESSIDEYEPNLDVLDAVIQSLRVEVE